MPEDPFQGTRGVECHLEYTQIILKPIQQRFQSRCKIYLTDFSDEYYMDTLSMLFLDNNRTYKIIDLLNIGMIK